MKIFLLSDLRGIFQQRTPIRSDGSVDMTADADCIICNGTAYKPLEGVFRVTLTEGKNTITAAKGTQRYRVESLLYKDGTVSVDGIVGTESQYNELSSLYECLQAKLIAQNNKIAEINKIIAGYSLF